MNAEFIRIPATGKVGIYICPEDIAEAETLKNFAQSTDWAERMFLDYLGEGAPCNIDE